MDCPPDVNTYIHRVGRTARYEKGGQAILVVTQPEEEEMLKELKTKNIPINKIEVNMKRITNIDAKLQSLCAGDVELKESAKRALMAYMRSIFLMKNKKLFQVDKIDVVQYSLSLGLVVAPRIRFLQQKQKTEKKSKKISSEAEDSNDSDDNKDSKDLISKSKNTTFRPDSDAFNFK